MPQSKILVDTNAYLRLAKTIRPLLFVPFGDNEYCLYILPELNDELGTRKLQSKFPWVDDEEFSENRKHFPQIGKKQKKSIQQTFDAQVMPTLELLKIMLDCGHADMKTINGLVEYWKYFSDMPANFKADYQRLFGD